MATPGLDKFNEFVKSLAVTPKIIILDIDYTLWPLHVDTHVTPPFKSDGNGGAIDHYGQQITLFKEVRWILTKLNELGIALAAASRTEDPPAARQLLHTLALDRHFGQLEIFPRKKFAHFKNIQEQSGIDYHDMLFFDDELRNIRDISQLGVTCIHVNDDCGLDMATLKQGLEVFSKRRTTAP